MANGASLACQRLSIETLARSSMRRVLVVIVLSSLSAACVHVEDYPGTWPALSSARTADDCTPLSGTYANVGKKPDGTRVWLAPWIAPEAPAPTPQDLNARQKFSKQLSDAHTVQLTVTPDGLTAKLMGDGISRQWTRERSKGEFECKNGVITIAKGGGMGGDNVIAFGSGAIHLYRMENDLIANNRGGVVGAMLFVPAAAYASNWGRFAAK